MKLKTPEWSCRERRVLKKLKFFNKFKLQKREFRMMTKYSEVDSRAGQLKISNS